MGALVQTEGNAFLTAITGGTAYTAVSAPIKLALMTANGSPTAAGTEVTGGSYARQTVTWNTASGGAISNSGVINFTNMPACTVVGCEVLDSTGSPRRLFWGPLAANKTLGAGDTFQVAASALVLQFP